MKRRDFVFGLILVILFILVAVVPLVMTLEATQVDPKEGTKLRLQAIRSLLEKADEEGILIEEGKRVKFEAKAREIRKIVYSDSSESRKG